MLVKVQSDTIIITSNLAASGLGGKTSYRLVKRSPADFKSHSIYMEYIPMERWYRYLQVFRRNVELIVHLVSHKAAKLEVVVISFPSK